MASIKPLDGGKHTGRSKRNLTGSQWRAAMILTPTQGPQNSVPSDDVIDVARNTMEAIGIIEYPGDAFGKPTHVITDGRAKLKMTGTGRAGDSLKVVGTEGKGGKAARDEDAFAIAVDDWADGDVLAVTLRRHVAGQRADPAETGTPADTGNPRALTLGQPTELLSVQPYQSAAYTVAPGDAARVIVAVFNTPGADYFQSGKISAFLNGGNRATAQATAEGVDGVSLGVYVPAGQSVTFVLGDVGNAVDYTVQADTLPFITVPQNGNVNMPQGTGRRAVMVDSSTQGTLTVDTYAGTGYVTVSGLGRSFAFGTGRGSSGSIDTRGTQPVILIDPDPQNTPYAFRASFTILS